MPRQARIRDPHGLYHVYQRSSDDRVLFRQESDRQAFWQVLTEASERFSFRLLGYCLLDPRSFHLLIKLDRCDISSLMKSINISFMRAIDAGAGLFRDRFQSDLIVCHDELETVYQKMEARAEGFDKWNSFCRFDQAALATVGLELADPIEVEISDGPCSGDHCLSDLAGLQTRIDAELDARGMSFSEMLETASVRNELIWQARRESTLTLQQLGAFFGGLSESRISKIIKQSTRAAAEDTLLSQK